MSSKENILTGDNFDNIRKKIKIKNHLSIKSKYKNIKMVNNLQAIQNTQRTRNNNLMNLEKTKNYNTGFNIKTNKRVKTLSIKKNWELDEDDEEEDYMTYGDRGYVVEKKKTLTKLKEELYKANSIKFCMI